MMDINDGSKAIEIDSGEKKISILNFKTEAF